MIIGVYPAVLAASASVSPQIPPPAITMFIDEQIVNYFNLMTCMQAILLFGWVSPV
jgi:hypothetical protein